MDLPRRLAVAGTTALLGLAIVGCGGAAPGQDGGGGGGGGESAAASPAKTYDIKPGDTTPFPLAAGTYRLAWTSTGCPNVNLVLKGDNGFENTKASKLPNSARIITSVPDGNYTVTQGEAACTTWTATISKVG